jgi:hypothetical protein
MKIEFRTIISRKKSRIVFDDPKKGWDWVKRYYLLQDIAADARKLGSSVWFGKPPNRIQKYEN